MQDPDVLMGLATRTPGNEPKESRSEDAIYSALVPVQCDLINGHLLAPTCPVKHGYGLRQHCSAVQDWYDRDHVQEVLYPEYENLMRTLVPEAEHIFVGGHICRNPDHDSQGKGEEFG